MAIVCVEVSERRVGEVGEMGKGRRVYAGECERGIGADGGVQLGGDEVDLHAEGVDCAREEEEETGYYQGEDSRAGHIFREGGSWAAVQRGDMYTSTYRW